MPSRNKRKTPKEEKIESLRRIAKDLKKEAAKETEKFNKKHILPSKEILTLVLKAHLFVEYLIDEIIKASFSNPNKILNKRKFSDKVNLLEAIGIEDSKSEYRLLRKIRALNDIRNKFAHNLNYKLNPEDLEPLIETNKTGDKETDMTKLKRALFGVIGYLQATRDISRTLPFVIACFRSDKLFKKDICYDIGKLLKDYEKELYTFFKSLKM